MSLIYLIIYITSSILALLLFYVSISRSDKEKTTYFSFFIFHIAMYLIGVTIEISSTTYTQALFANNVEYLGISFLPPYFILMVYEYADKKFKNKWTAFSLFVIPIISYIIVLTYPLNGLFYESFVLQTNKSFNHIVVESSIFRDILYIYFFLAFIYGLLVAINVYRKSGELIRKKVKFLIKGVSIPLFIAAGYIMKLTPNNLDFTPITMVFISAYFGYSILIKNSFLTVPFARSNVLEDMNDGYILVDCKNNYLDSNNAAKDLMPFLKNIRIGTNLETIRNLPKELYLTNDDNVTKEYAKKEDNGNIKYYSLTKSNIEKKKDKKIYCWIIHNCTSDKKMMENLEYIINHDSLTKIYNRNIFLLKASEMFAQCVAKNKPFAVLMLDLDFFKNINNTYGHICGDKVLFEVTKIINKTIKNIDLFARYGGEEFAIYLKDIRAEEAYKICEKIRTSVEGNVFYLNGKGVKISVSIGACMYNEEKHKSIDDIVVNADNLLYEAKKLGRNKTIMG